MLCAYIIQENITKINPFFENFSVILSIFFHFHIAIPYFLWYNVSRVTKIWYILVIGTSVSTNRLKRLSTKSCRYLRWSPFIFMLFGGKYEEL